MIRVCVRPSVTAGSWLVGVNVPTILFVHNDTYAFARVMQGLKAAGFHIVPATTPEEALATIGETSFDAVMMDCRTENAEQAAAALRIINPLAPVLMVSVYCGGRCCVSHAADVCVQTGAGVPGIVEAIQLALRSADFGSARFVSDISAA
jgi:DNA-binding NarL/FixJ family response regulator